MDIKGVLFTLSVFIFIGSILSLFAGETSWVVGIGGIVSSAFCFGFYKLLDYSEDTTELLKKLRDSEQLSVIGISQAFILQKFTPEVGFIFDEKDCKYEISPKGGYLVSGKFFDGKNKFESIKRCSFSCNLTHINGSLRNPDNWKCEDLKIEIK